MASVMREPNGRRRLQFVAGDGNRKTVRLGAVTSKQAGAIKVRVEQLVSAKVTGIMDPQAAHWVAGLEGLMYDRLARVGLVPPRDQVRPTLGRLLAAVFETLAVKPGTAVTYAQTRRSLVGHFGENRLLSAITALDAERWRQSMRDEKLADATVSKRVKTARQFFGHGIKWKMITENPLAGVKAGPQTNRARMRFISREDADKVLDACPNAEWRAIFALSRFGGLRCPSEHLGLRWADIDWDRGQVLVRSPKTEGHEGKESRFVPLFPELHRHLRDAFERAEPGGEFVITRYRDRTQNLRTQFTRIIHRAGLKPWPRLFHNLRATRQTELSDRFPGHVVCAWLGNSRAIAQDHYLQVTDGHLAAALRDEQFVQQQATQIPAQQAAAPGRTALQTENGQSAQPPSLRELATSCGSVRDEKVTPTR